MRCGQVSSRASWSPSTNKTHEVPQRSNPLNHLELMLQTIEKLQYAHGQWDCSGFPIDELRSDYFGDLDSIRESMKTEADQVACAACSDHQNSLSQISGIPFDRVIIIQTLCATLKTLKDVQSNCGLDLHLETEPIRHLIICGHRHCGFMRHWLTENRMMRPDDEDVAAAVEAYIQLQLALAATSPVFTVIWKMAR